MMGGVRGNTPRDLDNIGEARIRKIFKLCSLSAWEGLTPPTEIETVGKRLARGQGKGTSSRFFEFNLRRRWTVLLETPNRQSTENKNLNYWERSGLKDFCRY